MPISDESWYCGKSEEQEVVVPPRPARYTSTACPSPQLVLVRWVVFLIGWSFKNPVVLSIYLSKKRALRLSAYLSISPKNGRFTFFAFFPHAFVGFLKDEKWHVGPDFTPVSDKKSRGNGP